MLAQVKLGSDAVDWVRVELLLPSVYYVLQWSRPGANKPGC